MGSVETRGQRGTAGRKRNDSGRLADPHIAATNADLYRRYRAQGVELLGDAAPEKVEALATLMVGVVLGIVAQVTFDPERVNVEAALEEACKAVLARLTD